MLKFLNRWYDSRYLKKVKSIILELCYSSQVKSGNKSFIFDIFEDNKKLKPYLEYDYSLYNKALTQLINEKKLIKDNTQDPYLISLAESTFNNMSANKTPLKIWLKLNIFKILNLFIGLWGAITGTLALFLKQ